MKFKEDEKYDILGERHWGLFKVTHIVRIAKSPGF